MSVRLRDCGKCRGIIVYGKQILTDVDGRSVATIACGSLPRAGMIAEFCNHGHQATGERLDGTNRNGTTAKITSARGRRRR